MRHFLATLLAALTLSLSGCGYNTFQSTDEQIKASWSEVLNQYQRRADLIPNLVETVKGYAQQEKDVLTSVVEARAKATQVQIPPDALNDPEKFKAFQEGQAELSGALARLLAVVEAYPDLKSNQNFLALQSQLEGTENRINVSIKDYNTAVQAYNTTIRTFPDAIGAKIFYGAKPMATYEATAPNADRAPTVKF